LRNIIAKLKRKFEKGKVGVKKVIQIHFIWSVFLFQVIRNLLVVLGLSYLSKKFRILLGFCRVSNTEITLTILLSNLYIIL